MGTNKCLYFGEIAFSQHYVYQYNMTRHISGTQHILHQVQQNNETVNKYRNDLQDKFLQNNEA